MELNGQFWLPDNVDHRLAGVARFGPGIAPSIVVQGQLVPWYSKDQALGPDGSAHWLWRPVEDDEVPTVLGVDDGGIPLTLLEARQGGWAHSTLQESHETRIGIQLVRGAHLQGPDQTFTAFRCRVHHLDAWAPATQGALVARSGRLADGASVSLIDRDEQTWLQVEGLRPRTLRLLDRSVQTPLVSLITLAVGKPTAVTAAQVLAPDGTWCSVHSRHHQAPNNQPLGHPLIAPDMLDVTNIVTWLNNVDLLGPLPAAVASRINGGDATLETQVLELTTLAEGLYNRLNPGLQLFDESTTDAARDAAVKAVATFDTALVNRLRGLLQHLNEPGYRQKLRDLAKRAEQIAPGGTGRTSRWVRLINDARNDFAHPARSGWLTDTNIDRYLAAVYSLRWVLRLVILQTAGINAETLHRRLRNDQQFRQFLHNAHTWQPQIYT